MSADSQDAPRRRDLPRKNHQTSGVLPGNMTPRVSLFTITLLTAACLLTGSAAASASPQPHGCPSSDLRYPFEPGGPKDFGVFRLRIAQGSCATAHSVAKTWMRRFEAAFRAGRIALPRSVAGFKFTSLPPDAAQMFRERGQRAAMTIWFDYQIPNG
jgi:hypothetical protein